MGKVWYLLRPCSVVPMEGGAALAGQSGGAGAEVRAAAAGALGLWLAGRRRRRDTASTGAVSTVAATSALSVVLAFIVRYGKPVLPIIFQHFRAAWQNRAAPAGSDNSGAPVQG